MGYRLNSVFHRMVSVEMYLYLWVLEVRSGNHLVSRLAVLQHHYSEFYKAHDLTVIIYLKCRMCRL